MITIAGVEFYRVGSDDEWVSSDWRIYLKLDMSTPEHPWRTAIDGHWLKSNWSTPYVAIKRTTYRMGKKWNSSSA